MFSLEGLAAGTFLVQAVGPTGAVMTTSTATLSAATMKATTNLTASAAAAPAAQSAAVQAADSTPLPIWWAIGATAAGAGIISAVACTTTRARASSTFELFRFGVGGATGPALRLAPCNQRHRVRGHPAPDLLFQPHHTVFWTRTVLLAFAYALCAIALRGADNGRRAP